MVRATVFASLFASAQVAESASGSSSISGVGTCSDLCADGGHGTSGFISGTAPSCGGECADCGDGHCYHVESGSVSDYGHGCASGNKVCCCSKEFQDHSPSAIFEEDHDDGTKNAMTVALASKGFDYGTVNIICDEWFGTMNGGGHTQSECLTFCAGNGRCSYATYFADTGYCHIAVSCSKTAQTGDHPISYHKTSLAQASPELAISGVGTCSDLCADGGHGTSGFISGTAPSCGGECADCGDGHCYHVESGSVSDYGHGCASGNKVCCCSKEFQV